MLKAYFIALANRLGVAVTDESGAVTVDWVVITAGVIIFGLVIWSIIQGGIVEGASSIRNAILTVVPL